MERKQGFFSSLKEEILRGISPSKSRWRPKSLMGTTTTGVIQGSTNNDARRFLTGSGGGAALSPLREGPPEEGKGRDGRKKKRWGHWMMKTGKISLVPSLAVMAVASSKNDDLRFLLGVLGVPLGPVFVGSPDIVLPPLCIKNIPIETSSAQYILRQYIAACGGEKLQNSIRNACVVGKVKMQGSDVEMAAKVVKACIMGKVAESGGFVLWQMNPDMWYIELSVGGSKVHAGCNGKLVWRHTPWLGAHAAKGPVRPLRRAIQGLDPRTTAIMFANAKCIGEKNVNGEDCFILKLFADPQTLKSRSEGLAEIIRHNLFGCFSQKTGLLVKIEDSHLTRIQSNCGGDAVYWETTITSSLNDYRDIEGVMISHSGNSIVTIFRFGESSMTHTKTRMEEEWTIEEVTFNVHGLSVDCFIPPADIGLGSVSEVCDLHHDEKGKSTVMFGSRAKVVALGDPNDNLMTGTTLSRKDPNDSEVFTELVALRKSV